MRTTQNCRNSLIEKHGFSPEEADELVAQTWAEKARLEAEGRTQASDLVQAMEQSFDAERIANIKARQNTANSIRLYKEFQSEWSSLNTTEDFSTGSKNFVDFLAAKLVGEGTRFAGARASVDAKATGLFNGKLGHLTQAFEKIGEDAGYGRDFVLKTLGDKRNAADQMDFLKEVHTPGSTQNLLMAEAAKIFNAMSEDLRVRGNMAGGDVGKLPHGYFPQSHSVSQMAKAGVDKWVEAISPLLDWNVTMPDVPPQDRAGVLSSMYRTIVLNRDLQMHGTDYPMPRTTGNSKHRILHFKDGESFFKYHQEFGDETILQAVNNHVRQSTNRIAIMESLGTKPEDLVARLVEGEKTRLRYLYEDTKLPEAQRTKAAKDLSSLESAYNTRFSGNPSGRVANYMKVIMGETRSPVNITAAKVGFALRAVQVFAKMGMSAAATLSDMTTINSAQRAFGAELSERFANAPASYLKKYRGKEREIAQELGFILDASWGHLLSRFDVADQTQGRLSKAINSFYRYSGTTFMTEQAKAGHAMFMSRFIGKYKDLAWKDLDPSLRGGLEYHGFTESTWKLLRQMTEEYEGHSYLSPTMAQRLSEAQLAEFLPENLRTRPKGMSAEKYDLAKQRAFYRIRNKIETDVLAFFSDNTKFAVMEPDARVQAAVTQGTRPGTAMGEALRAVTQFKSWPIMYMQRQFSGRAWAKHGTRGADVPGMIQFAALTLMTGYLSLTLKDLARGRSPKDLTQWETLLSAAWQGGFFGIYGDMVFGPQFGQGGQLGEMVLGPTGGMIKDLTDIPADLVRGDVGKAGKAAARTAMANAPYMNLWFVKGAVDHFLFNELKEMMSPGYKARMVRAMEKTYGQRPLW